MLVVAGAGAWPGAGRAEEPAITSSVVQFFVSRIEVDSYTQSGRRLLSAQIDAAINSGNSGGPVISKGAIVGIAMQTLENYGIAEDRYLGAPAGPSRGRRKRRR